MTLQSLTTQNENFVTTLPLPVTVNHLAMPIYGQGSERTISAPELYLKYLKVRIKLEPALELELPLFTNKVRRHHRYVYGFVAHVTPS